MADNVIVRVPEQQIIKGEDGYSPEVTIENIEHGHSVTITDRDHPTGQSFNVIDGDSAYEQAVAGGYTGTETQFNEELASFKELSEQAADSAAAAAQSESNAAGSATTATTKAQEAEAAAAQALIRMNSAATSAQTAEDASSFFTSTILPNAVTTINNTRDQAVANVNVAKSTAVQHVSAEGATQISALQTESTTQQAAIEQKGEDVLESIPADYTDLTEDVDDLKSAFVDYANTTSLENFGLYGNAVHGNLARGELVAWVQYRVAINTVMKFDRALNITVKDGYRFAYHVFVNGVFSTNSPFLTGNTTIPANTEFKIVIAKVAEDVSEVADISEYVNAVKFDSVFQQFKSSMLAAIPYLTNYNSDFDSVAHQGYSTTSQYHGNSRASSFVGAYKHGFNVAETDIQWSSDGIAVCSHDPTFADATTGDTIVIADNTFSQLQTHNYFGEKIQSFEQVLVLCKQYGLKLAIDKVSADWTDEQFNKIFNSINRFQMRDNVWITCPNGAVRAKIMAFNANAKIVLIANAAQITNAVATAIAWEETGANVLIAVNTTNLTVDALSAASISCIGKNISIGCWTIDDIETYKAFMPYCKYIYSNKICALDTLS